MESIDVDSVNKAYRIGFDRTDDVLSLIDDDDDGTAEIMGIFISVLDELTERMNMSSDEVLTTVRGWLEE